MVGFSSDWQVPCPATPNKRKYRTSDYAYGVADGVLRRSGVRLAVYACAACGWFHLTRKVMGSDVVLPGTNETRAQVWRREHPDDPIYPYDRLDDK